MQTEVCSIYLLDSDRKQLVLTATSGLDQAAVGRVSMSVEEGLAGLVVQRGRPVVVVDAPSHPRYKYFPETGEERYHSFFGVPMKERRSTVGVLVVQTSRRRDFNSGEVELLKAISNRVSNIVVQARLVDSLKDKERERQQTRRRLAGALRRLRSYEGRGRAAKQAPVTKYRGRLTGQAVCPGFGYGKAYIMQRGVDLTAIKKRRTNDPEAEIGRLRSAVEHSISQVRELKRRMTALISDEAGAIFGMHRLVLEDPELIGEIEGLIRERHYDASYAVSRTFLAHMQSVGALGDEYLKERTADIQDVGQRLLDNLAGLGAKQLEIPKEAILVAEDLSPGDLALFEGDRFHGIVLSAGGVTSHASLLAKSFEIPTVVAVEGLLENVNDGDSLIVDGNSGVVFTNPNSEIISEYDRLERDYLAVNRELDELRDLPAETTDGHAIALLANVGLLTDIAFAHAHGAEGVGLYRTEIPFLAHHDFPSEEQQFALYQLELSDILRMQLRAILRVGALGPVRLLIPMVSSLEEILRVKAIVRDIKTDLRRRRIPCDQNMELGIMIEVPSAVQLAERLVREVDFVSIGTNDLIQYLLAVDRGNRKVASLYEPFHPAVLAALRQVITAAKAQKKRVGMCGEMAADPLSTLLLLGMGLDELSMESLSIPVVRKMVRSVSYEQARTIGENALKIDKVDEIKRYLFSELRNAGLVELLELYH